MTISVTDIFTIGIGPSSSHTVGPMRAAKHFLDSLETHPARVSAQLRGSLAATGRGHASDRAVILGLAGWEPLTVPLDAEPQAGGIIPSKGTSLDRPVPSTTTSPLITSHFLNTPMA